MRTSQVIEPSTAFFWGHNLVDYCDMFALTASEFAHRNIIECGCGPNAFHAQLVSQGGQVLSCDPLFETSFEQLNPLLLKQHQSTLSLLEKEPSCFLWEKFLPFEVLATKRLAGLELFLKDYAEDEQKKQRTYFSAPLNKMPYSDFHFDLALSTFFLFSNRLQSHTLEEYLALIQEWARIAKEVRIFPILDFNGQLSPLIGPILLKLQELQFGVEIKEVPYQWQAPGNAMLRIWSLSCTV